MNDVTLALQLVGPLRQRGMLNLVGQMKGSQAPVLGMVLILRKQRIEVASLFYLLLAIAFFLIKMILYFLLMIFVKIRFLLLISIN